MRKNGLILIAIGFLGGSFTAIMDKDQVTLPYFIPFFLVGVIGVVLVQLGIRQEAQDEGKREANFQILKENLAQIAQGMASLDDEKEQIFIYDLPQVLEDRFADQVNLFVEARESIAHGWGMKAYADVMSHFAAGERYMNRVWSTAADGYIDEAHTYVTRSKEQFSEAYARLTQLASGDEA